jgi:adenylosuccinate lyase
MKKDLTGTVSPLDGRYRNKTKVLVDYFSEGALIGYRAYMELQYLLALSRYAEKNGVLNIPILDEQQKQEIHQIMDGAIFTSEFTQHVKLVEKDTNHDVKAVEYVLRTILEMRKFPSQFINYCHFALTSEDVNNIAYGHLLRDAVEEEILPALEEVESSIHNLARNYANTPMMARTHGQPATPTTFGKEMKIYQMRLRRQIDQLRGYKISVKLNGASGNYNGHRAAYPTVDWPQFVHEFLEETYRDSAFDKPYFRHNLWTNQIEDHDTYAELFAIFHRINVILTNFSQDMWEYISRDLILQKKKDTEVGSSAMPHKVNPIDFENAEGNLDTANALFISFCKKLPVSRMQRDLSDSTVERNFGVAFAHSLIAYLSLEKGMGKIIVNEEKMLEELDAHPELLAEAYQLVLKTCGYEDAYEKMKDLTRGNKATLESMHEFLESIEGLPADKKQFLKDLRPATYLGYAKNLAAGFMIVDENYKLKR